MVPLYAATMFLGAALLFLLEPLVAKGLLPILGGGAGVWITCVAFFQAALLAGYAYAHLGPTWLGTRRHAWVHIALLAATALLLPLGGPAGWVAPPSHQALWLFGRLAVSIGPTFVLLAATAPLVQRWLASTDHGQARDPYFLYAASNAGSMLALLAYPALVEPFAGLRAERRLWNGALGLAIALLAACVLTAARRAKPKSAGVVEASPVERIGWGRRLRWLALAAVPSSLLLSLTTYATTDLVAIPLLWVVPLALYLLTFIVAFARRAPKARRAASLQPFVLLPLAVEMFLGAAGASWAFVPLHAVAFFVTALVCHQALADDRPTGLASTEFYLWMAAGGALGGLFNVFAAPVLFRSVLEYPLGLVAAALLRPSPGPPPADARRARGLDLAIPVGLAVVLLAGGLAISKLGARLGDRGVSVVMATLLVAAGVIGYAARARPLRFGLVLAAIVGVGAFRAASDPALVFETRSFYAVHRVAEEPPARRLLVHGNTLHGLQDRSPERRRWPTTYYTRSGPAGSLLAAYAGWPQRKHVAVAGLGVGTLAAYASPGEQWTFFEIDPAVRKIARDPALFTYLADAEGQVDVVLDDARLGLAAVANGAFGMILLDAFSSDAVPAHLLTREAIALYLGKLAPRGVVAFHLSNRHLDLEPVVAASAAELGLAALARCDRPSDAERAAGASPSCWLALARTPVDLAPIARDGRWRPPRRGRGWTDDASNVWGALVLAGAPASQGGVVASAR
jgi:hypothetical protein